MWTAASFCAYVLVYLNKYLSGSLYVNYYFDGLAGCISYTVGAPLYKYCKIKNSFIFSYIITLIAFLGLFLFESKLLPADSIEDWGVPPAPYPEGNPKRDEYYLARIIPPFTLLAKVGTMITFSNAYQASYSDPRTFPLLKRSTGIGICNFVCRAATIFSPLVAELDKPVPTMIMIIVTEIAIFAAFTFPSAEEEEAEMENTIDEDPINKNNKPTADDPKADSKRKRA